MCIRDSTSLTYVLNTSNYNLGAFNANSAIYSPWTNINLINWTSTPAGSTNLLATVHPYFSDTTNVIETGQEKVKKVAAKGNFVIGMKIFFKLNGSVTNGGQFSVAGSTHVNKTRKVKVYFETDDGKTYQFTLVFNLSNFRLYFKGSTTTQSQVVNNTPAL